MLRRIVDGQDVVGHALFICRAVIDLELAALLLRFFPLIDEFDTLLDLLAWLLRRSASAYRIDRVGLERLLLHQLAHIACLLGRRSSNGGSCSCYALRFLRQFARHARLSVQEPLATHGN